MIKKQIHLKKHLRDGYEMLRAAGLAKKFDLPESWIRSHTKTDCPDPIPCVRTGKYVRYEWISEDLNAWWNRHRSTSEPPTPQPKRIVRPALLKRKAGL